MKIEVGKLYRFGKSGPIVQVRFLTTQTVTYSIDRKLHTVPRSSFEQLFYLVKTLRQ